MKIKTERGASMVEYSLLIALVSIVCVGGVRYMGQVTTKPFCQVTGTLINPVEDDHVLWVQDDNGDGKPECMMRSSNPFGGSYDLWD